MTIIDTYIAEHAGNDCWITESYALIESVGKRYVLRHTFVTGDFEDDTFTVVPLQEANELFPYSVMERFIS